MIATDRRPQEFRIGFLAGLIMLTVQYLLGIAVNLFVVVPTNHPGANPPEYFSGVAQSVTWAILHGPLLLVLHATFGLVLLVAASQLLYRAIRVRRRGLIWTTAIGAVAVLGAGFNGGSYLNYHQDFSSMIMASFLAVAVVAYATGLYISEA
ncbi:MAG TPA: hypothetical protein VGG31_04115 [Candidatus Dormibacteraeota bacterium]